jgi:hypothetical protein
MGFYPPSKVEKELSWGIQTAPSNRIKKRGAYYPKTASISLRKSEEVGG